jgi:hypothetical protein
VRRKLTPEDLERAFGEQWRVLRKSCNAYDSGDMAEAKRIAAALRTFLHDTRKSRSLLQQLGMKDILFFDTAQDIDERNLLPTFGLVFVASTPSGGSYIPPLNLPLARQVWMLPFDHWWSKVVVRVPNELDLRRSDLVLMMANQDGGAHVDASIDERYYKLTREHVGGWSVATQAGNVTLDGIEAASVRQIAQEVLSSLISGYRTIPPDMASELSDADWEAQFGSRPNQADAASRAQFRNMCPCASGLEYAECHKAGAVNAGKVVPPLWARS